MWSGVLFRKCFVFGVICWCVFWLYGVWFLGRLCVESVCCGYFDMGVGG